MNRWHDPAEIAPAFGSLVRIETSWLGDDSVGMIVETSDTCWTFRKLSANKRSLNKRRIPVHIRFVERWRFIERWEHELGDES